jgi:hypothetical protein
VVWVVLKHFCKRYKRIKKPEKKRRKQNKNGPGEPFRPRSGGGPRPIPGSDRNGKANPSFLTDIGPRLSGPSLFPSSHWPPWPACQHRLLHLPLSFSVETAGVTPAPSLRTNWPSRPDLLKLGLPLSALPFPLSRIAARPSNQPPELRHPRRHRRRISPSPERPVLSHRLFLSSLSLAPLLMPLFCQTCSKPSIPPSSASCRRAEHLQSPFVVAPGRVWRRRSNSRVHRTLLHLVRVFLATADHRSELVVDHQCRTSPENCPAGESPSQICSNPLDLESKARIKSLNWRGTARSTPSRST